MNIKTEQTYTLTITLPPTEAQQVMGDFDSLREPSHPGKQVYRALADIRDGKVVALAGFKPTHAHTEYGTVTFGENK